MRGYKNALEGLEKDDYKTVEKKKVIHNIFNFKYFRTHPKINNQN